MLEQFANTVHLEVKRYHLPHFQVRSILSNTTVALRRHNVGKET
jgi:hypothetical protein